MGCQNSNTSEKENKQEKENKDNLNNQIEQNQIDENLLIGMHSGLLIKGLDFKNCLIKSQDEYITNLRMFIPTKIPKKQKNSSGFNLDDQVLTNSININFSKNYVIALKGFNNIEKVENNNGNYLIHHDGQFNNEEKYVALIVKKLEGNPLLLYSPQI